MAGAADAFAAVPGGIGTFEAAHDLGPTRPHKADRPLGRMRLPTALLAANTAHDYVQA
jgi:hypothetical protein